MTTVARLVAAVDAGHRPSSATILAAAITHATDRYRRHEITSAVWRWEYERLWRLADLADCRAAVLEILCPALFDREATR